jgi:hypothetical protein
MDKKMLSEELERMSYLFGHKRGVVVSEQIFGKKKKKNTDYLSEARERPDWSGSNSGKVDFGYSVNGANDLSIAKNTIEDGFYMSGKKMPVKGPKEESIKYPVKTEPEPYGDVILNPISFTDANFPYPDNMISPQWDWSKAGSSKELYTKFIIDLTNFINKGGFDKIKKITIQGSADSAAPTLDVPKGFSGLDHSSWDGKQIYDGDTKNKSKMNYFLANGRANVMKKTIVDDILKSTGKDISSKIEILPGISYYGQEGKRGSKFRSVNIIPTHDKLDVPVGGSSGIVPGSEGEKGTEKTDNGITTFKFNFSPFLDEEVEGLKIIDPEKGDVKYVVTLETAKKLELRSKIPTMGVMPFEIGGTKDREFNAEISNNLDLKINQVNFGTFTKVTNPEQYNMMNVIYSTDIVNVIANTVSIPDIKYVPTDMWSVNKGLERKPIYTTYLQITGFQFYIHDGKSDESQTR